jgi:flagella basal body P-ring formation protein FlgA
MTLLSVGIARRLAAAAVAALVLLVGPAELAAQAAPMTEGEGAVTDEVTRAVAGVLGLPATGVRVQMSGGAPPSIDSLVVTESSTRRWIVTLWGPDGPVRRLARVGVVGETAVASRRLERGHEVDEPDLRREFRVHWDRTQPPIDPVGMVTTRVVEEGEGLVPPSVRAPLLFNGGESVQALFEQGRVQLRLQATALGSARWGEAVHVRLSSGKRMSGRAVGPGLVRLTPGGAS